MGHNPARCLITGCNLIDTTEGKQVHGDLHLLDATYIFTACLTDTGEAAWDYTLDYGERTIFVSAYFERRGVIIASISASMLNKEALTYLLPWQEKQP